MTVEPVTNKKGLKYIFNPLTEKEKKRCRGKEKKDITPKPTGNIILTNQFLAAFLAF